MLLKLKRYIRLQKRNLATKEDRDDFKTIGFDPEELLQLKELEEKELTILMLFCGIRVYNGVPLCVLTADEMRMAYVLWRAEQIDEKKKELAPKVERGMKWIHYISKAVEILTR